MTLYAGEENSDSRIDEAAKVEVIEILSKDFQTAEGVHPEMKLVEIEGKCGKVKEIMMSEIEAREFAEFTNQPKGLEFRLSGKKGSAIRANPSRPFVLPVQIDETALDLSQLPGFLDPARTNFTKLLGGEVTSGFRDYVRRLLGLP